MSVSIVPDHSVRAPGSASAVIATGGAVVVVESGAVVGGEAVVDVGATVVGGAVVEDGGEVDDTPTPGWVLTAASSSAQPVVAIATTNMSTTPAAELQGFRTAARLSTVRRGHLRWRRSPPRQFWCPEGDVTAPDPTAFTVEGLDVHAGNPSVA